MLKWLKPAKGHKSQARQGGRLRYSDTVTKRHVEIDDEKLAAVREKLGTSTIKETVDAALDEVLALIERREAHIAAMESGIEWSYMADDANRR